MAFSEIAFRALQDVLGEENVSNDPVVCQAYSRVQWLPPGVLQRERCGLDMRPACLVMPGSTEEVQAVVKLANRYKFPFIPRGSGHYANVSVDRAAFLLDTYDTIQAARRIVASDCGRRRYGSTAATSST